VKRAVVIALLACGHGPTTSDPPAVALTSTANATPSAARAEACRARAVERLDAKRAAMADTENENPVGGGFVFESLYDRLVDCGGDDPSSDTCIIMQARISRAGTVVSSEAYVNEGVSDDVIHCLADVLRSARLPEQERDRRGFLAITFSPRHRGAR
jgi:hypothetical protein